MGRDNVCTSHGYRSTPKGYHTATPYLIVRDAARAITFCTQAFGATELMRLPVPNGKLGHAEIKIGDSPIVVADEFPDMGHRSPQSLGGAVVSIVLYVEGIDARFSQAIAAGARALKPVADQFYGDRSGALEDPFGHMRTLATHVDPGAEPEKSQKVIQVIAGMLACALIIVPGFDDRWRWLVVPIPIVLAADVLVVLGFLMIFLVFRANSYAASSVRVEVDQPVIATGPYRVVRHPIYAGVIVMVLATPFVLGSLWALLVAVPLCGVIVVRLLDEEWYLSAHLPGYDVYCQKAHVDRGDLA